MVVLNDREQATGCDPPGNRVLEWMTKRSGPANGVDMLLGVEGVDTKDTNTPLISI